MLRHNERIRAALVFRIMHMQRVLSMRAVHRFHGDRLAAFLSRVPDSRVDFPRFKILRQDWLLCI